MLNKEIKKRIDSARQVLVGKVPDPKAQVEQITTALIYKFMYDMDCENEELGGKARYFTGDLKEFSWQNLISKELSGQDKLDLYIRALVEFSKAKQIPDLFKTIFKDAFLPYRDPETLSLFLKEVNEFSYENSENLGNAFEYLLSILGSQGDAGQFRTPRHIIDFIVEVVDPKKGERILDPACGTAGFLISAYKHIRRIYSSNFKENDYIPTFAETDNQDITTVEIQKNGKYKGDKLTPNDKKQLNNNIVGYDISPDMVRLSLVNLYLHEFKNPQIFEYDTLTYEDRWKDNFDVILANPPFMTPKGGIRPHKKFQVQANRAEVLFVDYIAEHLKINGRAGIIVPEGIIFQSATAYTALRKFLIESGGLYAVVSLPNGVFNPYAGVKTSILFLDKKLARERKEIIFIKIENDGFDLGAQRKRIDKNNLPESFEVISNWKNNKKINTTKNVLTVSKDKVLKNPDCSLVFDRYKKNEVYKGKWKMITLGELENKGEIQFLRGQGISKKDIVNNGKNKCIHYGQLYTMYDPIINEVFSTTNVSGRVLSVSGDVLVPATTTADAMGIAIARALNKNNIILGGDINIIRTKNNKIKSEFLSLLLNFPLKKELASYAKGVNILHISNKDIKKISILLLPIKEQEKIIKKYESEQNKINKLKKRIEESENETKNQMNKIF